MKMKITLNGESREFGNIKTVSDLLTELGYQNHRLAVELNGEIVPKSQHGTATVSDGDRLEVVIAVGGG